MVAALAIHDHIPWSARPRNTVRRPWIGPRYNLAAPLIVPLHCFAAVKPKSRGKIPVLNGCTRQFPGYRFLFSRAANTYLPALPSATKHFFTLGRLGLTATCF